MRQKSNGTHLILMELMMVLFFFAICGSILLQVFVKAHNISAKAREMTETKNYVTQAAELIEAGAYDINLSCIPSKICASFNAFGNVSPSFICS